MITINCLRDREKVVILVAIDILSVCICICIIKRERFKVIIANKGRRQMCSVKSKQKQTAVRSYKALSKYFIKNYFVWFD